MPTKLKVLMLEDRAADAELVLHELRRAGFEPEWKRVETEPDFRAQLDRNWDILLIDYNLPGFDGLQALRIARGRGLDIPLIIVSGTIGEDKAVAAMKAGADDYVMKDRLAHLGPAIERELHNAVVRRGRKRAEEELKRSEERFKLIFEYAPDAYYLNDLKGIFIDGNKAAEKITGYSREELVGGSFLKLNLLSLDQLPKAALLLAKNAMGKSTGPDEFILKKKGGDKVSVEISTHPVKYENKTIILGIARDITERKRAEETLQANEKRFRALIEHSHDAITLLAADGTVLFDSTSIVNVLGYGPTERIGRSVFEFVHPEEREGMSRGFIKFAQQTGGIALSEVRFIHKDGTPRWIEGVRANLLHEPAVGAVVVNYRDITERKRAAEALRESEEKYRTLVENAAEAILIAQDGMLKFVNRTASDMTGYSEQELRSSPFLSFIHPDDQQMVGERHLKRLKGDLSLPRYSFRLICKNGSIKWMDIGAVLLTWEGKPATLNFLSDITESKRVEEALQASETRYRLLIDNAQFPIVVVSATDLRVLFINEHASHLFGVPAPQAVGLRASEFWYRKEDLYRFVHLINERRTVKDFEAELLSKSGARMIVLLSSNLIEFAGQQANITVFQDISARKRAEETLRTSEAQLSNALQMAHAGHWEYDVVKDTFTFNDNFYRIFRTTAADVGGYQMSSADYARRFCHPDDAVLVGIETRAAIESTDPNYNRQIEHRVIFADGEVGTITVRFFIVKDTQGRTVKTYGVNQDITDRRRAEEAVRQAETNFRRSLNESPLGVRIVSADGATLYVNRAILDMYGYNDIEELKSTPVEKRYTPESHAEFQLRMKKRRNGEDSSEYEIGIVRKSGEIRRLRVFRKEILWDGQKQFQAIYQDITEQKKMEEKLEETLGSLRNALGGIIQVLSATTENRDPYTAGHQRRVSDLARAIGQEMELAADRVEGLRLAGSIHDIGKISIPAEILSKPTRLTDIEFKLIQSHSQIGYDILRDIDFAWPLAEMVLQHHERLNGSGYPRRMKGEDLLLESRILAVSDVVEAMATHRPYRPALGIEVALGEIEKNKGVLYDPQVVSACLTLFRDKGFKFK